MKILIIEDDVDVLEMMNVTLAGELPDASLAFTVDAGEALEIAQRDCPDVVVLDSGVPGMSTEDLAEKLRRVVPQTRLVLYSALDRVARQEKAKSLGAPSFAKHELRALVSYISDLE